MLKVQDKKKNHNLSDTKIPEYLRYLKGEKCPLSGAYFRDTTYLPRVTLRVIATGDRNCTSKSMNQ